MKTPTPTLSAIEFNQFIEQELAALTKDTKGRITATAEQLRELHPETRLTIYLNAKSKRVWVADRQAFRALDQEFYFSLNTYIGGLKKADYRKYPCAAVAEAAEYHRAHFVPEESVKNKSEQAHTNS